MRADALSPHETRLLTSLPKRIRSIYYSFRPPFPLLKMRANARQSPFSLCGSVRRSDWTVLELRNNLGNRGKEEEIFMKNDLVQSALGRSSSVCAAVLILGLVVSCRSALSQATQHIGRPQFEPASIEVPAGNDCVLHPEGNQDPAQSIAVSADEDGRVRFQAVRATPMDRVTALALDCTDSRGISSSYTVDLQSEETFAPRLFDPIRANLALRPALIGDPLSYTQKELIKAGYGVRPDPNMNPDGYQTWLAAVSAPAYLLHSAPRHPLALQGSHPRPMPEPSIAPSPGPESAGQESTGAESSEVESAEPEAEIDANVFTTPSQGWTGARLEGSFKKGKTAADTTSYVLNSAQWNVPSVTPGGYETGTTDMTVWNGLGNVFQAILDVQTTSSAVFYGIHRQDFDPHTAGTDEGGTRFTPNAGDNIFAQEWYCDAEGNVNLTGGYACTYMLDTTQNVVWKCDSATTTISDCISYKLESADLANGNLGFWADFIIEDDTDEFVKNSAEWPDFSPITMLGTACVVKGSGATSGGGYKCEKWVSTAAGTDGSVHSKTDPSVNILSDANISNPMVRGDGHLNITLPAGGVKWVDTQTNIYEWNGSNFNTFSVACASSIGVGANSRGLTSGTPWTTGCSPASDGNFTVYQMQTGGKWVDMQNDIATQVAVSPLAKTIPWAINRAGQILYWNGSKFVENAAGGCATSIGVGPNSRGLTNGTPWITGCSSGSGGNHGVYQMQTGGKWVLMQDDIATQVAVGPKGIPWAVNAAGQIFYWNGSKFVENAEGGCASSIGVGPNSRGLTNGTPWITGCSTDSNGNRAVYQMQTGGKWVLMQSDVGWEIAVSEAGKAWVLSTRR